VDYFLIIIWYTFRLLYTLIGVYRKTIYNIIQRGELKAGKIGDKVIINSFPY